VRRRVSSGRLRWHGARISGALDLRKREDSQSNVRPAVLCRCIRFDDRCADHGTIADRWGHKWPVIGSALCFGVFTLLTARATTYREFLILRFLTGLGIGGALPNMVALAAEYVPKRVLPAFVAALFSGIPLGSMICGLVSS